MTRINPEPDRVRHTFGLGDVVWCSEHYDRLEQYEADPTFATLDLVERAETMLHKLVTEPADAEVRVDFTDQPATVHIEHADTGEEISVEPLCCVVDDETLMDSIVMARRSREVDDYVGDEA